MKIAAFSVRPDEKQYFDTFANVYKVELQINRSGFTADDIESVKGCEAMSVCDGMCDLSAPVLEKLAAEGVKYIGFRTIGYNSVDLEAAKRLAVICGVIGLGVNTISCLCVKELPEEGSAAVEDTQKPKNDKIGFVESLKLLISNKYYILIVAIYIVYYFMSNLTTGSAIYFMKHVLGNGSLLGLFSMMKMFPVIIALIFTPILVKKTGSMQKVNFWGYVISDILGIFLIIFAMQKNLPMMLLFMFLKGTFAGTMSGTLNALIAEISGYTYRTKGVHIDGMMFSCSSLGVKVGGGIGTAAVGWLLHAAGYAGKAATQTAAATNMIFSMYITIPVILGVVITILLGLMKVEKENKRIDMERAEQAD